MLDSTFKLNMEHITYTQTSRYAAYLFQPSCTLILFKNIFVAGINDTVDLIKANVLRIIFEIFKIRRFLAGAKWYLKIPAEFIYFMMFWYILVELWFISRQVTVISDGISAKIVDVSSFPAVYTVNKLDLTFNMWPVP